MATAAGTKHFAFLHAGGQGSWVWDETLSALRQQMQGQTYSAHAFDLPGCGSRRGEDTTSLTVQDVARAFVSELAASGLKDLILVGHSNAGTILPIVLRELPQLIRHVVYVSCLAPAPGQSIRQLINSGPSAAIGDGSANNTVTPPLQHFQRIFCNDMSDEEASRFVSKLGRDTWPTLRSMDEHDWRYDHLQGRSSTYILCLRDQTLPPEWQEQFALRFQVQRIVRIHAGHQVMNTRPHALAEILRHEG